MSSCEIVIIGAGPYGLSLAAHLAADSVPFRIFGKPMHSWRAEMPQGMLLKSEGFASSLFDPAGIFPLQAFCNERGLTYADVGHPVPLERFIEYGVEFQQRFVPSLEQRQVIRVAAATQGFTVQLADGETVHAAKVVTAVGVKPFAFIPPELGELGPTHLSHSSDHARLDHWCGREVIVIGAGASAIDLAALLHGAGARVQLVARRRVIDFHEPPRRRSRWERIRAPRSALGTGWGSRLSTDLPLLFHAMPESFRVDVVRRHLGPAAGWFVRSAVEGHVPMVLGARIKDACVEAGRVRLRIIADQDERVLKAEHVIAATGYRVDLRRIPFLAPELLASVRMSANAPVLSTRFETSLPGLFFIGPAAANSFGPLMRFAYGARFAARRVSRLAHRQPKFGRPAVRNAGAGAEAPTAILETR